MTYKNIVFDFGNVLFDLDLPAFERQMRMLTGAAFEGGKDRLLKEKVFELYETGGLSTEEFLEKMAGCFQPAVSTEQVENAWNAIFIGMPRYRFDWLLQLRRRYKVFLLSNINDLHERWIADYMQREHGLPDYESRYFDGVYFSHLIRLRKPWPEIYEYVLADAELLPEETLFFDDLPENIAAARKVGIQGVWHPPGTEICETPLLR
jgi:putative hydrolase of the HAD superfamily